MHGIQHYSSFVFAVLAFQAIPGAGTLAILNATARGGIAAGFAAMLGTLAGDGFYMIAAVAGLAGLVRTYPVALHVLQWCGAAYLCWLGIGLLRARAAGGAVGGPQHAPARLHFRRAFAVSLTNPKVMLFFVAFFPLFLRADAPASTLPLMMLHVTAISLAWQAALVCVGNGVARRLEAMPAAQRIARQLAGMSLLGFGLRLAAAN